jgi:hypothetical protein
MASDEDEEDTLGDHEREGECEAEVWNVWSGEGSG